MTAPAGAQLQAAFGTDQLNLRPPDTPGEVAGDAVAGGEELVTPA
jgi:hypothetical protein